MQIDSILAAAMVAILGALGLAAALRGPFRRRTLDTPPAGIVIRAQGDDADDGDVRFQDPGGPSDLRPAALDRIIRVGTWVFLFAVTTLVAVTDLWGESQGPILALLAAAGIYTFVIHERLPGRVPDTVLLVGEGILSVVFVVVLIALTAGASSPFFFALPLIVVGAATVVPPAATLGLTTGAGGAYVVAALAENPVVDEAWLTTVAINLTALGLIAYVGMAIGREQRRAREDANRLATIDPLTGLRTRAHLFGALERELARSGRTGRAFCLLMIDMDDLKAINDRYGHLAGDRALRLVGDVVRAGIRRIDTGARFGGDEFVVLLPETDFTGGWVLAEKVRQGVAAAGLQLEGHRVPTSVSVGLVTYPQDGDTAGALLEKADEAMYRSKRGGRDRTTGVTVMDVSAAGGDPDAATAGVPGVPPRSTGGPAGPV